MSGRMAAVLPTAGTPTLLYVAAANALCSVTVSVCNQGPVRDSISIQLCEGQAAQEDYLEYQAKVGSNSVLERSGLILEAGQSLLVTSAQGTSSFVCWGIIEAI